MLPQNVAHPMRRRCFRQVDSLQSAQLLLLPPRCASDLARYRISAEADEIIKVAAIEANTIYFIVSLQLFRPHNTSNH